MLQVTCVLRSEADMEGMCVVYLIWQVSLSLVCVHQSPTELYCSNGYYIQLSPPTSPSPQEQQVGFPG